MERKGVLSLIAASESGVTRTRSLNEMFSRLAWASGGRNPAGVNARSIL
jgi:hypothetical protein